MLTEGQTENGSPEGEEDKTVDAVGQVNGGEQNEGNEVQQQPIAVEEEEELGNGEKKTSCSERVREWISEYPILLCIYGAFANCYSGLKAIALVEADFLLLKDIVRTFWLIALVIYSLVESLMLLLYNIVFGIPVVMVGYLALVKWNLRQDSARPANVYLQQVSRGSKAITSYILREKRAHMTYLAKSILFSHPCFLMAALGMLVMWMIFLVIMLPIVVLQTTLSLLMWMMLCFDSARLKNYLPGIYNKDASVGSMLEMVQSVRSRRRIVHLVSSQFFSNRDSFVQYKDLKGTRELVWMDCLESDQDFKNLAFFSRDWCTKDRLNDRDNNQFKYLKSEVQRLGCKYVWLDCACVDQEAKEVDIINKLVSAFCFLGSRGMKGSKVYFIRDNHSDAYYRSLWCYIGSLAHLGETAMLEEPKQFVFPLQVKKQDSLVVFLLMLNVLGVRTTFRIARQVVFTENDEQPVPQANQKDMV